MAAMAALARAPLGASLASPAAGALAELASSPSHCGHRSPFKFAASAAPFGYGASPAPPFSARPGWPTWQAPGWSGAAAGLAGGPAAANVRQLPPRRHSGDSLRRWRC